MAIASKTKIPTALESLEDGGYIVAADQVYDESLQKTQAEINRNIPSVYEGGTTWYESSSSTNPVTTLRPGTGLLIENGTLSITSQGGATEVLLVQAKYTEGGVDQQFDITNTNSIKSYVRGFLNELKVQNIVYPVEKVFMLKDNFGHIVICDVGYAGIQAGAQITELRYRVGGSEYTLSNAGISLITRTVLFSRDNSKIDEGHLTDAFYWSDRELGINVITVDLSNTSVDFPFSNERSWSRNYGDTAVSNCSTLFNLINTKAYNAITADANPVILLNNSYEKTVLLQSMEFSNAEITKFVIYAGRFRIQMASNGEYACEEFFSLKIPDSPYYKGIPNAILGNTLDYDNGVLNAKPLQWEE